MGSLNWKKVMFMPEGERKRALADPEVRATIAREDLKDPRRTDFQDRRWDIVQVEKVAKREKREILRQERGGGGENER